MIFQLIKEQEKELKHKKKFHENIGIICSQNKHDYSESEVLESKSDSENEDFKEITKDSKFNFKVRKIH